jgi:tetratricopeptide (TPR) repeat protein
MFERFLRELRRRRVPHVAAFYLATAWILFEVADATFPRLNLPDWTVTLVLAMLLLAFPLVVGLAWVYEFTPDGIRRTPDAGPAARKAGIDSRQGDRKKGRTGGGAFGRIAVAGAILVLALAGGAFLFLGDADEVTLDPDAIAVLPFRVAGPPDLNMLREGMIDLLATKLTGETGPRAIDSRTTLSRYAEVAGDRELSLAEALRVAASLGAGRLLLGEVVGTDREMALNATVYGPDGEAQTRASVTGPPDSVTSLVDQLAATLLMLEAGEASHRLATLTTTSLPALRSYLAGQWAYRRGDFRDAVDLYARAVDHDSTFALAAMSLALASGWTGFEETPRGLRIAWNHKDRLNERDRAILVALAGPRYPEESAPIERIHAAQAARKLAPWDPHALYLLADEYFHNGEIAGYPDAFERAWQGFNAALAVDSAFGPALAHYPLIAAMRRDTAALDRYRRLRSASGEAERLEDEWLRAVGYGDDAARQRARPALDSTIDNVLAMLLEVAAPGDLPFDDLRQAADAFVTGPASVQERDFVLRIWMGLETAAGRFSELPRLARRMSPASAAMSDAMQAWGGLFLDGESEPAREALARLTRLTAHPPTTPTEAFWRGTRVCFTAYGRLAHGDTTGVSAAAEALSSSLCSSMLRAMLAVQTGDPAAARAVQRLDSLALWDPEAVTEFRSVVDLVLAHLYEALNEREAALAAVRRVDGWSGFGALAPAWLLRARLARDLGQTGEAVKYYRKYLELRNEPDPDSRAAANVEAARQELATLTSEG